MRVTGRRWKRPARSCPQWCASDHQCTARHGHPSGEHRSDPRRWRLRYGTLVATRIQGVDGYGRLEVRTVARLGDSEDVARWQAQQLAVRIDLTVRAVLGLPTADPVARTAAAGLHRRVLDRHRHIDS